MIQIILSENFVIAFNSERIVRFHHFLNMKSYQTHPQLHFDINVRGEQAYLKTRWRMLENPRSCSRRSHILQWH